MAQSITAAHKPFEVQREQLRARQLNIFLNHPLPAPPEVECLPEISDSLPKTMCVMESDACSQATLLPLTQSTQTTLSSS